MTDTSPEAIRAWALDEAQGWRPGTKQNAFFRAVAALAEAQAWRGMDSAPKDHDVPVYLFWGGRVIPATWHAWADMPSAGFRAGATWRPTEGHSLPITSKPTHWMPRPLPAPPEADR